jgi:hypothetical protein
MATLTVTSGPAEGRKIECKGEVVVGREGVDFVVDDDQMSRRHAAIRMGPSGVEIEDLGSLNGTFVDGERISSVATRTSNATLRMGTTMFSLEVSPADLPVADPQRTVARDRPVMDVSDGTVARDRPVIDAPERTVVRDRPVIDVPEPTTVRPTMPAEPGAAPAGGAAAGPPAPPVAPAIPASVAARPGPRGRRPAGGPPPIARLLIPVVVIVIVIVVLIVTGVI